MFELKINEEKNIITPFNFRNIKFIGATSRTSTTLFSPKYDTKYEVSLYFVVSNELYVINEKKEFKNNELIRVSRTGKATSNPRIIFGKSRDEIRHVDIKYLLPKNNEFEINKIAGEDYEFLLADKKMTIYGNEYFAAVKDDGYDSERLFGIFLKPDSFEQTDYDTFQKLIASAN